jgi:hypothetical protein
MQRYSATRPETIPNMASPLMRAFMNWWSFSALLIAVNMVVFKLASFSVSLAHVGAKLLRLNFLGEPLDPKI